MAVRGQPGIRFVEFTVLNTAAHQIARFYEHVLKCNQVMTKSIDVFQKKMLLLARPFRYRKIPLPQRFGH